MELCVAFSVEFFRFSVPEKEYSVSIDSKSISHINGSGELVIWSSDAQIAKKMAYLRFEMIKFWPRLKSPLISGHNLTKILDKSLGFHNFKCYKKY
jgi:hypothetical protein